MFFNFQFKNSQCVTVLSEFSLQILCKSMADIDSLHDLSSDQNEDQSAVDADVEEDEVSERG